MPELLPTLPDRVTGIVGEDPPRLQCHDCGLIYTGTDNRMSLAVILSGYHFHTCEPDSPRRCPDCLAVVKAACPNVARHNRSI